jgi:integrase
VAEDHASCFAAITADLGGFLIGEVSANQLSTWLAKRENPVSRNTYRKRIVSVWRWAQRNGYLPRELKTEAEQTDRAREDAPEIGIISADTFGALLRYFHGKEPALLGPLVMAGFCGMRRAEVHGQAWEDINLVEKHARVTAAKRGTPARRLVPLCDAAVEWLLLCPARKGALSDILAMDRIRLLAIEAKFKLPENCFRHAYISHRVAATGNIPQASLDAGNSPQIINRHYRELVTKAEGDSWFAQYPAGPGGAIGIKEVSA